MRSLWLSLLFGVVLFAQSPSAPFPNHELPPNGWFCTPASSASDVQTDAHACSCQGMTDDPVCTTMSEDPDSGDQIEVPLTNDNAKCKVFCHKDACLCAVQCHGS